jgi:glycosyltransferase involved in cell wall biosynthesis
MPPLVIVHLLSSFDVGGQERVALELARAQVLRGHAVHAVSLAPEPHGALATELTAAGVRVASVPRAARFGPREVLGVIARLQRLLVSLRADVLHTHNPQPLAYGAPAARLAGVGLVHTKHGANPDRGRRLWLRRAGGHLAHAYVAVSQATAAIARANRECPPARLHVIENGIDLAAYAFDAGARRATRTELGLPEDAWVFGTVGRVRPEKNHPGLVRAAAPLLGPDVRLVIVGDGVAMDALREAARPEAPWIVLTGARRDVPRLLSALDAFVLSSDTEGLPLGVVEAMAIGLPIVATAVGGVPDVLDHGRAGALVPKGDEAALRAAMRRVREEPAWARALADAARTRAAAYSLDAMVDAYLALYAQAAHAAHAARRGVLGRVRR